MVWGLISFTGMIKYIYIYIYIHEKYVFFKGINVFEIGY